MDITQSFLDSEKIEVTLTGDKAEFEHKELEDIITLNLSNIIGTATRPTIATSGNAPNFNVTVGVPPLNKQKVKLTASITLTVEVVNESSVTPQLPPEIVEEIATSETEVLTLFTFDQVSDNNVLQDIAGNSSSFVGDAAIRQGTFRYGNASLLLYGGSVVVDLPNNKTLGYTDFTIECWYKPSSTRTDRVLLSRWSDVGDKEFLIEVSPIAGSCKFYYAPYSIIDPLLVAYSAGTTMDWTHLAIQRQNDVFSMYINGRLMDEVALDDVWDASPVTTNLLIGNNYTVGSSQSNNAFWGDIDSLRIVRHATVYSENFVPGNLPLIE
jgi:hypothetical protein